MPKYAFDGEGDCAKYNCKAKYSGDVVSKPSVINVSRLSISFILSSFVTFSELVIKSAEFNVFLYDTAGLKVTLMSIISFKVILFANFFHPPYSSFIFTFLSRLSFSAFNSTFTTSTNGISSTIADSR